MYKDIDVIQKYINAADYLTVAQIFLKDNFFLERKLKYGDLKKNLKGHWGTSPGVNFIYAHLIFKKARGEMFSCCRYGACGRSTTIQFVFGRNT